METKKHIPKAKRENACPMKYCRGEIIQLSMYMVAGEYPLRMCSDCQNMIVEVVDKST